MSIFKASFIAAKICSYLWQWKLFAAISNSYTNLNHLWRKTKSIEDCQEKSRLLTTKLFEKYPSHDFNYILRMQILYYLNKLIKIKVLSLPPYLIHYSDSIDVSFFYDHFLKSPSRRYYLQIYPPKKVPCVNPSLNRLLSANLMNV